MHHAESKSCGIDAGELLDRLPLGLFVLDANHVVRSWNRWLAEATSVTAETALGKRLQELFPQVDNSRFLWGVNQAIATKSPQVLSQTLNRFVIPVHIGYARRHGITMMQQRVHISPVPCEAGEVLAAVSITDVTDNVLRSAALTEMAHKLTEDSTRDPLTGLYNRRFMWEWLAPQIKLTLRDMRPLASLLFDIDHFKKVNDAHGHDLGDSVIISFAEIVVRQLRGSDILVRYGGEEFVALLPNCDLANAICVAGRLLKIFRHSSLGSLPPGQVTASIGVAVMDPANPITGEELLKKADRRLYLAKQRGRDQIVPRSLSDHCP